MTNQHLKLSVLINDQRRVRLVYKGRELLHKHRVNMLGWLPLRMKTFILVLTD